MKKNSFIVIILLVLVGLLSSCDKSHSHVDSSPSDCVCDECQIKLEHSYIEGSCICQVCNNEKEHIDTDNNCECDVCKKDLEHKYTDKCICDICSTQKDCVDSDDNCICDECGTELDHNYIEGSCVCTICLQPKEHVDENNDCLCDECEEAIEHKYPTDSCICEVCSYEKEHISNNEQYCEVCGKNLMNNIIDYNNFKLTGFTSDRYEDNYEHWLKIALDENMAMIEVFERREENLNLVPWFGEFPGKYLMSLCYAYEMRQDSEIVTVANRLISCFERVSDNGYLGPYSVSNRLIGNAGALPENDKLWDLWGNYHIILSLIRWYELTNNTKALKLAKEAADYIINFFKKASYKDAGAYEMNLAITHAFAKLYNVTKEKKYLDESVNLINNVWMECGANWYQNALSGGEFYQSSLPRWESLHPLMALSELYIATKDQQYLTVMGQVWESIREFDIHNAGSFTSNETATGDPYADNNIETCCTIAWMEYSIEYMKLVENSLIADYMELAQFNAVYGSQLQLDEKQGNIQYYTYDTPMNGSKVGAVKSLIWQSIGRAADVSCCQLNGPKGPSLIGQWGFYKANTSYYLNYYGQSSITFIEDDVRCVLNQETVYPLNGAIRITLDMDSQKQFSLKLRIPSWSVNATLKVNGVNVDVKAGTYHELNQMFNDGDVIELDLGMTFYTTNGGNGYNGCVSIYYGPILLGLDEKNLTVSPDDIIISQSIINTLTVNEKHNGKLLTASMIINNEKYELVDYASCGRHYKVNEHGSYYRSWINYK